MRYREEAGLDTSDVEDRRGRLGGGRGLAVGGVCFAGSVQTACGGATSGSSEQWQRWFLTGYRSGDPAQCDTFATDELG